MISMDKASSIEEVIDPLNLFKEIGESIKKYHPNSMIMLHGSRVNRYSRTGKWDFDLSVGDINRQQLRFLQDKITDEYKDRIDENGKKVRIDLSRFIQNEESIEKIKRNAILL